MDEISNEKVKLNETIKKLDKNNKVSKFQLKKLSNLINHSKLFHILFYHLSLLPNYLTFVF